MQMLKTETQSGLSFLVNNQQALQAAERLSARLESGVRFCCDTRQQLTVAQGRQRDLASASRKAHLRSADPLEESDHTLDTPVSNATVQDDDADADLLEFEQAADDFDATALFDGDDDLDSDEADSFSAAAADPEFEVELS